MPCMTRKVMPRTSVTAMFRTNPVWSFLRIAHTPNWQVNDEVTRRIVAGPDEREDVEHVLEVGRLQRRPDRGRARTLK